MGLVVMVQIESTNHRLGSCRVASIVPSDEEEEEWWEELMNDHDDDDDDPVVVHETMSKLGHCAPRIVLSRIGTRTEPKRLRRTEFDETVGGGGVVSVVVVVVVQIVVVYAFHLHRCHGRMRGLLILGGSCSSLWILLVKKKGWKPTTTTTRQISMAWFPWQHRCNAMKYGFPKETTKRVSPPENDSTSRTLCGPGSWNRKTTPQRPSLLHQTVIGAPTTTTTSHNRHSISNRPL